MNSACRVGQQSSVRGIYYAWWTAFSLLWWFKTYSIRLCHQLTEMEKEAHHRSSPAGRVGGTSVRTCPHLLSLPTQAKWWQGWQHVLEKGAMPIESSRNRETRNKETRNKALGWDPGLPARLNLFEPQEQDKVREIRRQTHTLLHSLWFIYQILRMSIIW